MANLAGEAKRRPEELGDLLDVRVTDRGKSGRVLITTFETSGGKIEVGGDRVRWVLRRPDDGGILRSTWFQIDTKRRGGVVTALHAEGRGFGHGIGMCQWGAMGMAEEGYHFPQILEHYYPGVKLTQVTYRLVGVRAR